MRTRLKYSVAALALASIIASSLPAGAGPVPGNLASVGASAPSSVIDVRSRGSRGAGVAAGLVAGAIVGGLIAGAANPYYGPGPYYAPEPYYAPGPYYGPGYVEGPTYYRPRYYRPAPVYIAPGPVYVEPPAAYSPNGPVRRCWVSTDKDRGYGYWRPC